MSDSLRELKEAAERWKAQSYRWSEVQNSFESLKGQDRETLADFAARILSGMPDGKDLPAGPWHYMGLKHDNWGLVRGPDESIVADTCTHFEGREFYDWVCDVHGFGSPEWKAGPAKASAVAELLIWARGVVEISKQQSAAAGE